MGLWTATAMVIGNMIGSGVFLLPAALAGVAVVYGSSVVARLGGDRRRRDAPGRRVRDDGSRVSRGRVVRTRTHGEPSVTSSGFQTAWGYWIAAWVGNAAIAIGVRRLHDRRVARPRRRATLAMALLAVGAIWLLTFVNILGVREGGAVQVVTTILKFVPLALIGVIGLFSMDTAHFTPFLEAAGTTSAGTR